MRQWINLFESQNTTFYHGSSENIPVGTVLRGRQQDYEEDWSQAGFYSALEKYRPEGMISHKEAVFMCDNDEDIDSVGGGTDWVLVLKPLGKVQRHDMNWGSRISAALEDQEPEENIRTYAEKYWNGTPYEGETLWEYLTTSAEVVSSEPF